MNKSDDEFNAIVNAAWKNDLETIRTMVANGFDLATINKSGESVLDEAIFHLMDYYNDTPQKCNYDELSPNRCEVVKFLLDLGANPNQLDADGFGH